MNPCHAHLAQIIGDTREDLVRESTDIAFRSNASITLRREDVEQMIRACVALLEEGLVGESTSIRAGFLEALPEVARASTWDDTLRNGIPCWGVLLGKLSAAAAEEHRAEAIVFLSSFMGAWWADVSKAMLPVFTAENRL